MTSSPEPKVAHEESLCRPTALTPPDRDQSTFDRDLEDEKVTDAARAMSKGRADDSVAPEFARLFNFARLSIRKAVHALAQDENERSRKDVLVFIRRTRSLGLSTGSSLP